MTRGPTPVSPDRNPGHTFPLVNDRTADNRKSLHLRPRPPLLVTATFYPSNPYFLQSLLSSRPVSLTTREEPVCRAPYPKAICSMALIGKIRNNPLIVLLFIGGGIALFVLSDIMNSGNSGAIGPVEALMGRAGEVEIERNEFERTFGAIYSSGDNFQNRDNLWQFYVNEGLVRTEAAKLGLAVSDTEMEDLTFGPNPSPVIRRNFGDPQTGQVNREFLTNVQRYVEDGNIQDGIDAQELSPNFVPIWKYQRREVNAQRLQEKLGALVSKAMYAPSWQAQDFANSQVATRDIALVRIPFDKITASAEVSDSDLEAYINENRSIYENDQETRLLTLIQFEVAPTQEDSAAIRASLNELKAEWASVTNDSLYALANNGSYTGASLTRSNLPPAVADRVIDELSTGDIYGPYLEGNAMKLAKVVMKETLADSANTRQILIGAGNPRAGIPATPQELAAAEAKVDSLIGVLRTNRSQFSDLAAEFSTDQGSANNGGVYEKVTPGQFVRAYDDILFRTGELNTLYKVRSVFGWHVVEVLKRSNTSSPRAKVAYIVENIEPSIETQEAVDVKSQEFLAKYDNLADAVAAAPAAGATVKTTRPLSMTDYNIAGLGSGQEVRQMLCWAYTFDEGEISDRSYTFDDPQLFYRRYYVLAGVDKVIPKGLAPVAAVRENVEPIVMNRAKGQAAAGQLSGKSLDAIAQQYGSKVDTLRNVNPTMSSLAAGVGREPRVLAAAMTTATNSLSTPIIGENGVYVIKPLKDAPGINSGNLPGARQQINTTSRIAVANSVVSGMRAAAEVEDKRAALECN